MASSPLDLDLARVASNNNGALPRRVQITMAVLISFGF
jgi:hypothetical protein